MGLRDLRAGTTAVIGDSCPASEIDILTADITEIISSKLAEGSNIESTIVLESRRSPLLLESSA